MNRKFAISISSGVYTRGLGGTNKVICAHQNLLNSRGISYFYLCPVNNAITRIGRVDTRRYWNVIVDGKYSGVLNEYSIVAKLANYELEGYQALGVFIHHLREVDIPSINALLEAFCLPVYYYIHDYYAICESYNLLDSNGSYCGGKANEHGCLTCLYREEAEIKRSKIKDFLYGIRDKITFIAPSDAAKDIWVKNYPEFAKKTKVIYHQRLLGEYSGNREEISKSQKIRVGFVGAALSVKGWEEFRKLISSIKPDRLQFYELYHMGTGGEEIENVTQVKVTFHSGLNAMVEALRNNKIDCAILWSLWPETYSYTYYECYSANAFVLTYKNSGNMCDQVKTRDNGIVFQNIDEMIELFNEPELLRNVVNQFYNKRVLGPEFLEENDEFISLLAQASPNRQSIIYKPGKQRVVKEKLLTLTEKIMSSIGGKKR